MDMFSDSYLESVQQNEKDAFSFLCDAAEKRVEKPVENKPLTEVIAIVRGKKANNVPMLTAQEELCEDYLQEWAQLFGSENAK